MTPNAIAWLEWGLESLGDTGLAEGENVRDAKGRVSPRLQDIETAAQQRVLAYDRAGDGHYDTVSAFIKSLRGNDPDAALYCGWYSLAKYVDAFDWKPGAVAYHLASSEAHTLRGSARVVGL